MKKIYLILTISFCLSLCACGSISYNSSSVVDRDIQKDNAFYSLLKYVEGKKADDVLKKFEVEGRNAEEFDLVDTVETDMMFAKAGAVKEIQFYSNNDKKLNYDDVTYNVIQLFVDDSNSVVGIALYPKLSLRVATDFEDIIKKAGVQPRKVDKPFSREIYDMGNVRLVHTYYRTGGEQRGLFYVYK